MLCIVKFIIHQYFSENRIRRIHKMHVAGRYYRNIKRLTQLYDYLIEFLQILNGTDIVIILVTDKKFIIQTGLYLQIIIE